MSPQNLIKQSEKTGSKMASTGNDDGNAYVGYTNPIEMSQMSPDTRPLHLNKMNSMSTKTTIGKESEYMDEDRNPYEPPDSPRSPTMDNYLTPTNDYPSPSPPLSGQYLTPRDNFTFEFKGQDSVSHTSTVSEIEMPYLEPKEKGHNNVTMRSDSGVEDCESNRTSTSPRVQPTAFSFQPRMSTHPEQEYEDIDFYRKQHEKRRSSRKKREQPPRPKEVNDQRPLPKVHLTGVTRTESYDNRVIGSRSTEPNFRATQNSLPDLPVHAEAQPNTPPHTYTALNVSKDSVKVKKESPAVRNRTCCILIIVLIFNILLSLAALSIGLYVLLDEGGDRVVYKLAPTSDPVTQAVVATTTTPYQTTTQTTQQSTVSNITELLHQLQIEILGLKVENSAMKALIQQQTSNFTSQIQPVKNQVEILTSTQFNMSKEADSDLKELERQIANISLTPGPQGPTGVADFSLCEFKTLRISGAASDIHTLETSFVPNSFEDFVIFAFCDFQGATDVKLLHVKDSKTKNVRYRCECKGKVSGEDRTSCTINYWTCPIVH